MTIMAGMTTTATFIKLVKEYSDLYRSERFKPAYVSRVAGNVVNSFSSVFSNSFDIFIMLNLLKSS